MILTLRLHELVQRLSCSTSGKFRGIRTVTFNSPTIFSYWLRKSCRPSSEQYRSCSVLSKLGKRRYIGSKNWSLWIGRLENRFQIGVMRRWSQAPGYFASPKSRIFPCPLLFTKFLVG